MRKCFVALCVALTLLASGPAMAAGEFIGTLSQVWAGDPTSPSKGWIALSSNMATPACASHNWFVFDLNDPVAKIHYATALTAMAAGRVVRIYGTGTCDGNQERLRSIAIIS